jgi:hypothetical protein
VLADSTLIELILQEIDKLTAAGEAWGKIQIGLVKCQRGQQIAVKMYLPEPVQQLIIAWFSLLIVL